MSDSQEKYTKIFKATFSLLDKNIAFNLINNFFNDAFAERLTVQHWR